MRAVIVSHGQPGEPEPQQRAIEELAAQIAHCDPGCDVRGATLAMPGALEICDDNSLIYPMFMAEGWFTGSELPRRLAETGAPHARIMRPFGTDPGLPPLIAQKAVQAARNIGWWPSETTLLLTAHGSQRSTASFIITNEVARKISPQFARVVTGFVEQEPYIHDAAVNLKRAVSLPFFALKADHVLNDLPAALDKAGFGGPRLDPVGLAPEIPALIARAIRRKCTSLSVQ